MTNYIGWNDNTQRETIKGNLQTEVKTFEKYYLTEDLAGYEIHTFYLKGNEFVKLNSWDAEHTKRSNVKFVEFNNEFENGLKEKFIELSKRTAEEKEKHSIANSL